MDDKRRHEEETPGATAAAGSAAAGPAQGPPKGHPKGLWVLFITEMWERFSYYGMRALLVLYLIQSTNEALESGQPNLNPGFGWDKDWAYLLFGIYCSAVYFTPIFGGWLADKFLGTHRSMLLGGWIIAAGHITLAATHMFGYTIGEAVTFQTGPGALLCFLLGLVLIVIGTGFFKPCVSVMVGQLYEQNDPRRDSGFTIFYMGINLGAFFSPLVAGSLGELYGWHWGFGSAAVGMLAGLFCYQVLRPKYLPGVGLPTQEKQSYRPLWIGLAILAALIAVAGGLYLYDGYDSVQKAWKWITATNIRAICFSSLAVAAGIAAILVFIFKQEPRLRAPLGVIFILAFIGNIFFWTAFEQAGSSMNVFAKTNTDRTLGGLLEGEGFPASYYQSVNPFAILVFAPVFAWLWVWLNRRRMNPSTPMKFSLALYLLGLAFLAMVLGGREARGGNLAGPHWLLITYVIYTWGELCLSPVGLSMVTKLAPKRLQSLMMGLWFFSFSLANLLAGLVARISTRIESGEITFVFQGLPGFYFMLVVIPIGAGLVILLLTPLLKRMMHGVD